MTYEKVWDMTLFSVAWDFFEERRSTRISSKMGLVMLQSLMQIAQKGTDYSLKEHIYLETG